MPVLRTLFIFVLLITAFIEAPAQICTGSLGDPVVNIDFGKGLNPGPQLSSKVISYSYLASGCPNDGYYTILSSCSSCFADSWHILPEDHTPGDINGYMLLVNASFAAGVFYVDTVRGLCGGTTYEFAAWALNIMKPTSCSGVGITPNLTFTIETPDGQQVLGTYTTGNIVGTTQPKWIQYGLYFTTPTNVNSVVLRMKNANPGGCGNDVAIDDITFRPCGPQVNASLTGVGGTTSEICEGKDTVISMTATVSNGFNQPAYQWQFSADSGVHWADIPGATSLQYVRPSNPVAGKYYYRMAAAETGNLGISSCRVASNLLTITVDELPAKRVGSNSPVCSPHTVQLTASGSGSYSWTGPNGFTAFTANASLPASTPTASGTYSVSAINSIGCSNQNSLLVTVLPQPDLQTTAAAKACDGAAAQLQASGADNYKWYLLPDTNKVVGTGSAISLALKASDTLYAVACIGSYVNGCTDTALSTIQVFSKPTANAGPDRYVFAGDSTTLLGSTGKYDTHYWTPDNYLDNKLSLTPKAAPPVSTQYTLAAESNYGCGSASDDVLVHVYQAVTIPNAFSPNGDGINDNWQIRALESYPACKINVFDRYGQLVLQQTNYNTPWDGTVKGKPVPVGLYYYVIDLGIANRVLNGSVMVIR